MFKDDGTTGPEDFLRQRTRIERILSAISARDGLWDWDTETNALYSPSSVRMLGYTPEQFPQHVDAWFDRMHKDDFDDAMRRHFEYINSAAHGDRFECLYRILAADGSYRWILSRGKVVERDANGRGKRVIGLHTDVTELRMAQESLSHLLNFDQLTKLHSRFAFDAALASLEQQDHPVSIIYLDVDGMKLVNDTLGHAAGDRLLIAVAALMRGIFRASDTVARIGGDEFVALLPRCPERAGQKIMRILRSQCAKRNAVPGAMPICLSMGLACTGMGLELSALQAAADHAMMRDKAQHAEARYSTIKAWLEMFSDRRLAAECPAPNS
jgi:diguanylate cyclase (GGDEF)-like protein/PAS domain S-box-containing protein